jgi:hypothetical protein
MMRSKACRGRIGIAFFALGFSSAAAEVHAQTGGTAARRNNPSSTNCKGRGRTDSRYAHHTNFRSIAMQLVESLHSDTSKMGDL